MPGCTRAPRRARGVARAERHRHQDDRQRGPRADSSPPNFPPPRDNDLALPHAPHQQPADARIAPEQRAAGPDRSGEPLRAAHPRHSSSGQARASTRPQAPTAAILSMPPAPPGEAHQRDRGLPPLELLPHPCSANSPPPPRVNTREVWPGGSPTGPRPYPARPPAPYKPGNNAPPAAAPKRRSTRIRAIDTHGDRCLPIITTRRDKRLDKARQHPRRSATVRDSTAPVEMAQPDREPFALPVGANARPAARPEQNRSALARQRAAAPGPRARLRAAVRRGREDVSFNR